MRVHDAFIESTLAAAVSRLERIDRIVRSSESLQEDELRILRTQVLMARDTVRAAMILSFPGTHQSTVGRSI